MIVISTLAVAVAPPLRNSRMPNCKTCDAPAAGVVPVVCRTSSETVFRYAVAIYAGSDCGEMRVSAL